MTLAGRHIVVGVGGGIAAFKSVHLVRELMRRGAEVRVIMTPSATHFIGPLTFSGITGQPAVVNLFSPDVVGEVHVGLANWADALVVAPATANLMARAAQGMANDVVLATMLCADCPTVLAPAMHTRMWQQPSTRRNVTRLADDGMHLVGPERGPLASGEVGDGRMSEPEQIADAVQGLFGGRDDLAGRSVVVSAGPTHEDLDPVRFLGNRSTGRMGYAIADRAAARGAEVTLVSGPVSLAPPPGVELVSVRSAVEMHQAIAQYAAGADLVVMAAAVADYRPAERAESKIKKSGAPMTLSLVRNPDILASLGAARRGPRPVLVGFALETDDVVKHAREKLLKKQCDLVVANEARVALGGESNQAVLVDRDGERALETMSKHALAERLLDRASAMMSEALD